MFLNIFRNSTEIRLILTCLNLFRKIPRMISSLIHQQFINSSLLGDKYEFFNILAVHRERTELDRRCWCNGVRQRWAGHDRWKQILRGVAQGEDREDRQRNTGDNSAHSSNGTKVLSSGPAEFWKKANYFPNKSVNNYMQLSTYSSYVQQCINNSTTKYVATLTCSSGAGSVDNPDMIF